MSARDAGGRSMRDELSTCVASESTAAAPPADAASHVPSASTIRVATSFTAPWISFRSALQGTVAGSGAGAGAWLGAAAVVAGGDECSAEAADVLGEGVVD